MLVLKDDLSFTISENDERKIDISPIKIFVLDIFFKNKQIEAGVT